jgi:XTP/dITP diphosphohydrolase
LFLFYLQSMKLIIATNNIHKVEEIRQVINKKIELLTLNDIGFKGDIQELEMTLEGNAVQKAFYIFDRYHISCFADDTGLEIDALNGEPGVFSARYAGENCSYEDNIEKVLSAMQGIDNRNARFRTIIALIINRKPTLFEGIVLGTIIHERRGTNGFGYDPIFQPSGLPRTFAELSMDEKNKISHRAIAIKKLVDYFEKQNP